MLRISLQGVDEVLEEHTGRSEVYGNLPQLAPVLPKNWWVSEFHRKILKLSHVLSFGGRV